MEFKFNGKRYRWNAWKLIKNVLGAVIVESVLAAPLIAFYMGVMK